jgi:hypothetical protein
MLILLYYDYGIAMSYLTQHQLITNQKRKFSVKNKEDISLFKRFVRIGSWGKPCPFILEEPYLTIPDMIKDKYIKYQLGIE